MVKYYPLDKIFKQGETYQLPNDRFYVIKAIGTDATSDAYLFIDGVKTGPIISDIAPLHKTSSNLLGPLQLGDLFYVVPPNKQFSVEGSSGAKIRAIGLIGVLAPGEAMPPQFVSRFTEQGKHYLTYVKSTETIVAKSGTWAADSEVSVLELTPKTIETYIFNREVLAKVENTASAISAGQVAVRFYLEGTPLDILTSDPGHKGIDILSMPYPPSDSTNEIAFSLKDLPVEVKGDQTFEIKVINVSGAGITASDTADMTATIAAIVEFIKKA